VELPVFPLTGVILLPRVQLPLNIFEPRYLAMIDAVLSGARLLGVLQPSEAPVDSETESPPGKSAPLQSVGTVGRLSGFQETPDGRYIISLTGVCRFHVERERQTENPFRMVNVDYAPYCDDLIDDDGTDAVDRTYLLQVLKSYLKANDLSADWSSIDSATNTFLINTLSMICPYGPQEKQALLEAGTLAKRAEVLIALAEMELASNSADGSGSSLQ